MWGDFSRRAADGADRVLEKNLPLRRRNQAEQRLRPGMTAARGRNAGALRHLRLQVILRADFLHQIELRFEPVDVFFLTFENVVEQLAGHVIAN